ncbi:retrotransposon protein, putative, ty3-gypsy subclass [Tanacetum coccineum]
MERRSDGALYFMDRIWVSLTGNVRTLKMDEAHKLRYSVHPGADKMYYDLRDMYRWPGMKKDIALYVSKCLTCLKVKAKHQKTSSLLQQPEIPELTKSAHFLPIYKDFKMDKLARLYLNKIVARHASVSSRPLKIYSGHASSTLEEAGIYPVKQRKPLEFSVGDRVLLKVSPWKGVVRFRKKGKLAPQELSSVHDMFHVSNLKKCLADPILHVPLEEIQVYAKLNFVEEPVEILEREMKKLKRS